MDRLVKIRSQARLCRERAALDVQRRVFWLSQAEEWERQALQEITSHFRRCNQIWGNQTGADLGTSTS